MIIKNYAEDYVSALVEYVTKDWNEMELSEKEKMDVLAYVLNRVPPKYVVSSRGQLHTFLDFMKNYQDRANAIALIFEGMEIVKSRRANDVQEYQEYDFDFQSDYYVFPTVIGRVFDMITLDPVAGAEISLYVDGELVEMITPLWKNPFIINSATKEYFNFLPKPVLAKEDDPAEKSFSFEVKVNAEGYVGRDMQFSIKLEKVLLKQDVNNLNNVYNLPPICLGKKD